MPRVLALIPDLLFGSRVQADLTTAGHEVDAVASIEAARERLADADVLIVDLTDEQLAGLRVVEEICARRGEGVRSPRTLGFYSHVDVETRERAQQAGIDLVVPRSRMAREGGTLVGRLLDDD